MKINLTPETFSDLVISYLLDCLLHSDEVTKSNRFNELVEIMELKGMKSLLLMKYLDMDSNERLNYKRIKKSLTDKDFKSVIEIKKE